MTKPTFCKLLIESCETHSDRLAMRVVGDTSEDVTFGEMLTRIRAVAFRLGREGVGLGDRVAVIGENHPSWAIAYLATLYAGAVCVPLDPHGEKATLANFIADSEAKVVFADPESAERLSEIISGNDSKVPVVVWGKPEVSDLDSFDFWTTTEYSDEFAAADPPAKPEDNAVLIYTSGTTGKPKGVLLSHSNINAELDAIDGVLEFTDKESVLSLLPLFHAYLQIVNLWLASTKGAKVFYLKELSPDELSKGMLESKMTVLTSVPRLWYLFHKKIFDAVAAKPKPVQMLFRAMLRINGFTRDYLNINLGKKMFGQVHDSFGGELDLAVTAGSRFDESVAIDFHRLGFTIIQGYGLSETSGAATGTYVDDNRVGSVGKPMGDAEVKIDSPDENGEGEVLIRGSMVFKGYYKNPEATAEAFTEDGWFKSGDLGKFDKDGHLYITGRAKDVIVLPSGKNVHPEDLEVHYMKSPLVEELCVIGVTDETSEHTGAEKLVGIVVPDFEYLKSTNISNSGEAIRFELDNLGRELPEYQRVREYVIRAEPLPRTATRKIKRFELRKDMMATGTSQTPAVSRTWDISTEDAELIATPTGQILTGLITSQLKTPVEFHPDMNLEIDLRMDSLSRAEVVAGLEQAYGVEFEAEKIAKAYTIRDVLAMIGSQNGSKAVTTGEFNWSMILKEPMASTKEIDSAAKRRPFFEALSWLVLKSLNLFFRLLLRLQVKGVEKLSEIDGPFLICPNHQSYIDAVVICSTYPAPVLKKIFHVGASEYFQNFFMAFLAKMLRIVPIDPDTQLLKAMKAGANGLERGMILNIYPEGERAFDGKLHKFKNGAAILSTELGLPIVPVAIDGMYKVWGRGSLKIRAAKVKVEFCDPIVPAQGNVDYAAVTATLKETIGSKLEEMRKED